MTSHSTNLRIQELEVKVIAMLQDAGQEGDSFRRYFFLQLIEDFTTLTRLYRTEVDHLNRTVLELDKKLLFLDV